MHEDHERRDGMETKISNLSDPSEPWKPSNQRRFNPTRPKKYISKFIFLLSGIFLLFLPIILIRFIKSCFMQIGILFSYFMSSLNRLHVNFAYRKEIIL